MIQLRRIEWRWCHVAISIALHLKFPLLGRRKEFAEIAEVGKLLSHRKGSGE